MKQKCSICKSTNLIPYNHIIKNRYTEEFSTILKLSEENLEREYSNLICRNCSFIFKKKWFNKTILRKIYNKIVNSHPRGWDVISNKFNLNYFNKQIVLLENLLNKNANILKLNHIKRTIFGITNSLILNKSQKILIKNLNNCIKNNDLKNIKILKKKIKFDFKPLEFSRYSGFKSLDLFNHINLKLVELNKYGEIGCPLWGMINIANKNKCKTYFVKPESDIFWGSNCKFRGKHCVEKLNDTKVLTNINNLKKKELDYLGIYNLLDHFENPIKVIGTLLKYTKSIGIITEKNKNGIPIQHHNILSEKVFKYISKSSKKRLDTTFNKKLLNTEYNFYLIY